MKSGKKRKRKKEGKARKRKDKEKWKSSDEPQIASVLPSHSAACPLPLSSIHPSIHPFVCPSMNSFFHSFEIIIHKTKIKTKDR